MMVVELRNMSTIYFIRHGQASFGSGNYDKLSDTGMRQARLLAEHFNALGIRFDAAYSGTLVRHAETAQSFMGAYPGPAPGITTLDGLNEYQSREILTALVPILLEEQPSMKEHSGRLLQDKRSFQTVFEAVMLMWASGRHDVPGLQRWRDFQDAVRSAVTQIMRTDGSGKRVAVFTSGGPISVIAQQALGLDDGATMRLREQVVNSSVSRFKCTPERIMMSTFNEYTHLERAGDASLITYR